MKRYYDKRDKDWRLIEKRRAEKGERRCVKVCIPVCVCVCAVVCSRAHDCVRERALVSMC